MIKHSDKGFSLVQVLIATGILGGMAVALMNMQKNSTVALKTFDTTNEIIVFHSKINTYFTDKAVCERNFVSPVSINANTPVIPKLVDKNDRTIATNGAEYATGAFQINQIATEKDPVSNEVSLVLTYERGRTTTKVYGSKTVTKRIPLIVTLDPSSDNITSCSGVSGTLSDYDEIAEEVCARMKGFTWNNIAKTCDPFFNTYSRLITFEIRYNGATWSITSTKVLFSTDPADNVPVALVATEKINDAFFKFRVSHRGFFINSSQLLTALKISKNSGPYKLTISDSDGNNKIEVINSDDSSMNAFQNGDVIKFIFAY